MQIRAIRYFRVMNWRSLLLMPAMLVMIAHSLIAHEHSNTGAIIPEFVTASHSGVSLLNCFISSDTGEEHLEAFLPGSDTPEISFSQGSCVPIIYPSLIIPGSGILVYSDKCICTGQNWVIPDWHKTNSLSRRGPPAV